MRWEVVIGRGEIGRTVRLRYHIGRSCLARREESRLAQCAYERSRHAVCKGRHDEAWSYDVGADVQAYLGKVNRDAAGGRLERPHKAAPLHKRQHNAAVSSVPITYSRRLSQLPSGRRDGSKPLGAPILRDAAGGEWTSCDVRSRRAAAWCEMRRL